MDLGNGLVMRNELTVNPEKTLGIHQLIDLIQGIIDRKPVVVGIYDEGHLILAEKISDLFYRNGFDLVSDLTQEARLVLLAGIG